MPQGFESFLFVLEALDTQFITLQHEVPLDLSSKIAAKHQGFHIYPECFSRL